MTDPAPAAVIAGVGAWVPPRVVTNDDLAARMDTSDEWIRTRTGIRSRHFAEPGTATSDLAVEAGRRALASADVHVDTVVVATITPDQQLPHTAPLVAERLGLGGAAAFDVSAACSGFVYGLAVCAGLIAAGTSRAVLFIGADTFSTTLNPDDRTSAVIFGDGAGAVVLRAGNAAEPGALGTFDLGSDGGQWELATIRGGGSRQRLAAAPFDPADEYFAMEGKAMFKQAALRMADSARIVAKHAGWRIEDVDRIVSHQANLRIVEQVAYELGVPAAHCLSNIDSVGNTVAASIPLAMADAVAKGDLRPGHRVLVLAFGGGLTWGGTAVRWPSLRLADPTLPNTRSANP
ncbi:beta-ketoacyl-ACP synthase III [Glycomyces paridis]|uniref:Beta-ketoacyl-[acyl-carrier-protein] synthase III n=1 Tax=Glycomyces paridis TaxID=2126555 RepID=A0A4S8PFF3_9ACTN|nr:beta-ketoacyl-ACP synthase III [Glycomyces paridis]THV29140.1 ketoacyl-ACP synthase III [Glycomyces paridis]